MSETRRHIAQHVFGPITITGKGVTPSTPTKHYVVDMRLRATRVLRVPLRSSGQRVASVNRYANHAGQSG